MKTTNLIGKFYTLQSVIKLKLFLLCQSLPLKIFDFHYIFYSFLPLLLLRASEVYDLIHFALENRGLILNIHCHLL